MEQTTRIKIEDGHLSQLTDQELISTFWDWYLEMTFNYPVKFEMSNDAGLPAKYWIDSEVQKIDDAIVDSKRQMELDNRMFGNDVEELEYFYKDTLDRLFQEKDENISEELPF